MGEKRKAQTAKSVQNVRKSLEAKQLHAAPFLSDYAAESLAAELELAGVCQETKGKAVYWVISTSGATSATAKSTWPSMVVVNTIMLSPCTKRGWGSI